METYEAVLDALGDRTRREIVSTLRREGPSSVADLAERLPVTRPAVSQHLRVLRDAALVDFHQVGTRNVYRLAPDGAAALRSWLDDLWTDALGAFESFAHAQETTDD